MNRILRITLCCLAALAVTAPAAEADFWEDGYKNFFADRPKVGHARWIQLQKQGWAYLQRHAKTGNAEAMIYLGRVYYSAANQFSTGFHKDARVAYPGGRAIRDTDAGTNRAEGCRWYLKAANAGHVEGMVHAAACHENGYGVPQNNRSAIALYRRAAEKGNYNGSWNLGKLYADKIGDFAKAREWYQYGIDRGLEYGFYGLGRLWEEGKGGPKDLAKARQLYERTEYPKAAKYYLGKMYEDGRGGPRDEAKALALYKEASGDEEVGNLAVSRIKALENKVAAAKKRAEEARRAAQQRKQDAAQKAEQERRKAAEHAEAERIAKLTAGLRQDSGFRKVAVANAVIRALPERKAKAGRKLERGEQVHVIGVLPTGWVRIAEEGAPVGWLHESALEAARVRAAPPAAPMAVSDSDLRPIDAPYVTLKNANVRAAPAVAAQRVATLPAGTRITALGRVRGKDWILVERDDRRLGYVYAPLLAPAEAVAATATTGPLGRYHALVIGNSRYQDLPSLKTAAGDARMVAATLKDDYGFATTLLVEATRVDIISALDDLRARLREDDNLLIYYAGHGWLDEEADRGYWLPVDATEGSRVNWVSNTTITDALKALKSRHVLVMADSCYSGTLTRGLGLRSRTPDHLAQMAGKRSRTVLTSGGLEPVTDRGGGDHSVFAKAVLDALAANDGVLDGARLFGQVERVVKLAAPQEPRYSDIRFAGHEGGDFLFARRK